MKLVLDTNIFISAFYWGGNAQKIIDRIITGLDELYVSDKILEEIFEVMTRPKFKTDQETIDKYIKTIEKDCKKVFTEGRIKGICRDKDDDDKLECGIICNADYIITGDDDLLVLENYKSIKIITPGDYLAIIQEGETHG